MGAMNLVAGRVEAGGIKGIFEIDLSKPPKPAAVSARGYKPRFMEWVGSRIAQRHEETGMGCPRRFKELCP